MYLPCLALLAISILAECTIDFSKPVDPFDYQQALQQGFDTNLFKLQRPPAYKYSGTQNIQDIYDRGFRNFRIRCEPATYKNNFEQFLIKLKEVVNDCINIGVAPVVTWIGHEAEAYATEEDLQGYLDFWRTIAETFKDTSYLLSFNLFTELGTDICFDRNPNKAECGSRKACCTESLRLRKDKYHRWTSEVIKTIRGTGGNSEKRILILGSPEKTHAGLRYLIGAPYLATERYVMAEWHVYAAGPKKDYRNIHYWTGSGTEEQKSTLRNSLKVAKAFTKRTGIPTFHGEWQPIDNQFGEVTEFEAIAFARFFVTELKAAQIPWSLNAIEKYYNTQKSYWKEGAQIWAGASLHMDRILDAILEEL